jgi:hypothetical protein
MHVGAALRLLLLILLLDASPVAPGAGIQGDPILPPCGTKDPFGRALGDPMHSGAEAPSGAGVSHGRALGDPMHPGGENPGGAPPGVLLVGAIPSQEIPREAGEALEGGTVGQGDPIARDSLKCLGSTLGGTVGQGDPIARDPPRCLGARALHGRALGDPMHPGVGELQLRSPGGTVGQGDPIARDPRRSLVELRVTVVAAIVLSIL